MIEHQPEISTVDLIDLYSSVGWTVYAEQHEMMSHLLEGSLWWAADIVDGQLRGLIRVVGDDLSIAYIQDVLVRPEFHRQGIGRALVDEAMQRFGHVRQVVLVTEDNDSTTGFYRSVGLTEIANEDCVCFVRFGATTDEKVTQ